MKRNPDEYLKYTDPSDTYNVTYMVGFMMSFFS